MKIKQHILQFVAFFLIVSGNYAFSSDKQENNQGKSSTNYTKNETSKNGNQETITYSSISKDYMSDGKCTETKYKN